MKKRFAPLLGVLLLTVVFASTGLAATIDALPAWPDDALYAVGSIEETKDFISALIDSRPFGLAAAIEPDFEMVAELLRSFPLEAASFAFGLTDEGFSLHGALKFDESKGDLLKKLADGEGEEGDIDALLNLPFPSDLTLAPFEGGTYAAMADGMALVLLTVDGEMLLMGMSPEDLESAKGALADSGKRIKLPRRLPHKNFFYFHDNGMAAAEIAEESDGLLGEPVENLMLEIGYGTIPNGFGLSLLTNFARVFGIIEPEKAPAPIGKDDLVKLGGGHAWLAWAARGLIDQKHFEMVRQAAEEGDSESEIILEVLEQLKTMGLTEEALLSILKSMGVILGGEAAFSGIPVPGGYAYVSGEKEAVELLLPLIEVVVSESGLEFESVEKPGWQALYVLKEPVDAVLGIRDGAAVAGLLTLDSLEDEPELGPDAAKLLEEGNSMLFHFDMGVVRRMLTKLLDPDLPIAAIFLLEEDDFLDSAPALFEGLKATAGFKGIQMTFRDFERLDLLALLGDPDEAEIKGIEELASKWQPYIEEREEMYDE
ncbi:MAG: hypothetical protein GX181_10345 [Synergistaceae bacterium]|nr:hypothetical protein [Synergistota bacterium]NLM72339.1 hypothetical protein [Synergistaceae bacterium]